ncbi:MAG: hypothetical protein ACUVWK_00180 [Nitrososphaerales archaeon]
MPENIYRHLDLLLIIGLSFFGLFIVVMLAITSPTTLDYLSIRKPLVGSVFASICILGMVATFSPRRCSRIFYRGKEYDFQEGSANANSTSLILGLKMVHGHHPDCEGFSSHEFRIGGKTFCTGCIGLFFGALISIFGTIAYFSRDMYIPPFFTAFGLFGVALGLLAPMLNLQIILRFSLNVLFILGMFLILIGVDAFVQSLSADLLLISLYIFWLFARISLSQWNHRRICLGCTKKCGYGKDVPRRL